MPWLNEVKKTILAEILLLPPDEQLLEALLWRGFLAHLDEGRLKLIGITPQTDAADIASLKLIHGVGVTPKADLKWCAEIDWEVATQEGRQNAIREHSRAALAKEAKNSLQKSAAYEQIDLTTKTIVDGSISFHRREA